MKKKQFYENSYDFVRIGRFGLFSLFFHENSYDFVRTGRFGLFSWFFHENLTFMKNKWKRNGKNDLFFMKKGRNRVFRSSCGAVISKRKMINENSKNSKLQKLDGSTKCVLKVAQESLICDFILMMAKDCNLFLTYLYLYIIYIYII